MHFHRHLVHGLYLPTRYYASSGDCKTCGSVVHTRPRLIHHLNHGTTDGLAWYIPNIQAIQPDELLKLDDKDRIARRKLVARGLKATRALIPALRPAFRCAPEDSLAARSVRLPPADRRQTRAHGSPSRWRLVDPSQRASPCCDVALFDQARPLGLLCLQKVGHGGGRVVVKHLAAQAAHTLAGHAALVPYLRDGLPQAAVPECFADATPDSDMPGVSATSSGSTAGHKYTSTIGCFAIDALSATRSSVY